MTELSKVDLDEFRWNLAAIGAIVETVRNAVESNPDTPQESTWRTLSVAADLCHRCLTEFDSDAFEAAWKRPARAEEARP
jgi:hypothetical protein